MIPALHRVLARHRAGKARKAISQARDEFLAAPDIQFLSNMSAVYCTPASYPFFADCIRQACLVSLRDMGLEGPWADAERRTRSIEAMRILLADVVPDEVLDLAMGGLS